MGYLLKMVCDMCGTETDIPVVTAREIYESGKVMVTRAIVVLAVDGPEIKVQTNCWECSSRSAVPPGYKSVSGAPGDLVVRDGGPKGKPE
jgi:hypothetical protein